MVGGTAFFIYQLLLLLFFTLPLLWFLPDKETKVDILPFGLPELGLRLYRIDSGAGDRDCVPVQQPRTVDVSESKPRGVGPDSFLEVH
jgi:hypothetical protein